MRYSSKPPDISFHWLCLPMTMTATTSTATNADDTVDVNKNPIRSQTYEQWRYDMIYFVDIEYML